MAEVVIRIIAHGSAEYEEAVALRYRVLREPLGLTYPPEQLAAESADIHFAAYDGERVVGALLLTEREPTVRQMRQVAVEPALQGRGVGRAMVAFAEDWARRDGVETITLHARETAVPFYLRLGYESFGPVFIEVGRKHIKMRKALT